MLLMAIDHTRDYFSSIHGIDPTNPLESWPALFATRWITHLFMLLRIFHGYGDENRFEHLASTAQTLMSFQQVAKYPPSLQYLLAILGVVLLLYAAFDVAIARNWLPPVRRFVEV